jgi:hypothetical protein
MVDALLATANWSWNRDASHNSRARHPASHPTAHTPRAGGPNSRRCSSLTDGQDGSLLAPGAPGSYTLPWAAQISGSFQSYPGDARNATVDGTILAEDPGHISSCRIVDGRSG